MGHLGHERLSLVPLLRQPVRPQRQWPAARAEGTAVLWVPAGLDALLTVVLGASVWGAWSE
jgi:hypothetical protein